MLLFCASKIASRWGVRRSIPGLKRRGEKRVWRRTDLAPTKKRSGASTASRLRLPVFVLQGEKLLLAAAGFYFTKLVCNHSPLTQSRQTIHRSAPCVVMADRAKLSQPPWIRQIAAGAQVDARNHYDAVLVGCHGYLSPPALARLPATAFIHVAPLHFHGMWLWWMMLRRKGCRACITSPPGAHLHLWRVFCLSACLALHCLVLLHPLRTVFSLPAVGR